MTRCVALLAYIVLALSVQPRGAASASAPTGSREGRIKSSHAVWVCSSNLLYVNRNQGSQTVMSTYNQGDGSECNGYGLPSHVDAMAVDSRGNLWAAFDVSYNEASQVGGAYMIPPGKSSPSMILSDGGLKPSGIALGSDGTVYISNWADPVVGRGVGQQTNVEIYNPGAAYPSRTLLPPRYDNVQRIAIDRAGNLYAHYVNRTNGTSGIVEWAHAQGTAFDLGVAVAAADSLQTTKSGALLACGGGCYEINHGRIIRTFAIRRNIDAGGASLSADEKSVFVISGSLGVGVWRYPRGGRPVRSIDVGGPTVVGSAGSPAALPGAPYNPK